MPFLIISHISTILVETETTEHKLNDNKSAKVIIKERVLGLISDGL